MYTTGISDGDEKLKRPAQTRADASRGSKGFDKNKDTVLVRGVYSGKDVEAALGEANKLTKQYGAVGELTLF